MISDDAGQAFADPGAGLRPGHLLRQPARRISLDDLGMLFRQDLSDRAADFLRQPAIGLAAAVKGPRDRTGPGPSGGGRSRNSTRRGPPARGPNSVPRARREPDGRPRAVSRPPARRGTRRCGRPAATRPTVPRRRRWSAPWRHKRTRSGIAPVGRSPGSDRGRSASLRQTAARQICQRNRSSSRVLRIAARSNVASTSPGDASASTMMPP